MKISKLSYIYVLLFLLTTSGKVVAQQLIHYWNFNNNSSLTNLLTPTSSQVTGASITHIAGGISTIDFAGGTGQNFSVANHNARNGDTAGTHLRFNDPIGGQLVFAIPTTGYRDPIIKFATRRSGSGAGSQYWEYSLNGTVFIPFDTIAPNNGDPLPDTFNFSSISGADNNPNFKLRVSFAMGAGGTVGNNRFDNFTVDANVMSVTALVHYWNFNNNSSSTTLLTPTVALVAGASITHVAGGTSLVDFANGTGQNFNVANKNARNGDTAAHTSVSTTPLAGNWYLPCLPQDTKMLS